MGDSTQVIQFKIHERLLNLAIGFLGGRRECLLDYILNIIYVKFGFHSKYPC